jgi:hypothetical protein
MDLSYTLDESERDELEMRQPFLKKFEKGFKVLVSAFNNALTIHNSSTLIGFMIEHFLKEWERVLMGMKVNELGASRLGIFKL